MTDIKVTFGKRNHRGSLQESLDTSVEISEWEFQRLLGNIENGYGYYCYDERCHQILFLSRYMDKVDYTWLFIQIERDVKDE